MSIAQAVLAKLEALPPEKQQEVLDFAEFLYQKYQGTGKSIAGPEKEAIPRSRLGERLRELRAQIVASGERLLTAEEIEQEIAEQRDRLKDLEP